MVKLWIKADTRKRRVMEKQKEIRMLQSRRDQLIDHKLFTRAKAVETQIFQLIKQVKDIEDS